MQDEETAHVMNTRIFDNVVITMVVIGTVVDVSMKLNYGACVPGMVVLWDFAILKVALTKRFGDCANYMEGRRTTFVALMGVQIVLWMMPKKVILILMRRTESNFVCIKAV